MDQWLLPAWLDEAVARRLDALDADRYGERSLARLYAAAGARSPGEAPRVVEAGILRTVLRTKRSTLVSETRSYARRIRSRFV